MKYVIFCFFLIMSLSSCQRKHESLNGYVDTDYKYLSPSSSGFLKKLNVKNGELVKAGSIVFALDDTILRSNVNSAQVFLQELLVLNKNIEKEYNRSKALFLGDFISRYKLDLAKTNFEASRLKVIAAKQALLAAKKRIYDSAPIASESSYVQKTFFQEGEFVSAGQPVVSLFSPKNIKIKFFVAQNILPSIKINQKIKVICDGCPREILAYISHISNHAEFTPPIIYSKELRQKMVFEVEAKLISKSDFLHPGVPVDVNIG